MSGFKISTGTDLDTLFEDRTTIDPSGQYVPYNTSNGKSLSERYLSYTSGTKTVTTGFCVTDASGNAQDLNNYYSPFIPAGWSNYGYPAPLGTSSSVRAIHINNGDIYTGGAFGEGLRRRRNGVWTTIFDITNTGISDQRIWAIHSDGGNDLYIGGTFKSLSLQGGTYNYIVRYDISNNTINYLGNATTNGTDSTVRAIYALDASRIYVGGSFANVMGTYNPYSCVYNKLTNTWSTTSNPIPNNWEIYAFAYYNGFLYLGGALSQLRRLNTSTNDYVTLATLGSTSGGALIRGISVVDANNIYIATGWGLYKWNGSASSNLYSAAYCQPICALDANNVLIGTGASTNWLAKYNGSTVTTYNNGVQDVVHAIVALSSKKILVGGDFDSVNTGGTSVTAPGFAFNKST